MKTLLLIRHAKSDWHTRQTDHQRPLNQRGERDAPVMAQRIKKRDSVPDLLIHSDAKRAARTSELMLQQFSEAGIEVMSRVEPKLYATSAEFIIDLVAALDDKFNKVAIVGHNPEMSNALASISDEPHDLVTCAVAELHFNIDSWQQARPATLAKLIIDTPKKPYFNS